MCPAPVCGIKYKLEQLKAGHTVCIPVPDLACGLEPAEEPRREQALTSRRIRAAVRRGCDSVTLICSLRGDLILEERPRTCRKLCCSRNTCHESAPCLFRAPYACF